MASNWSTRYPVYQIDFQAVASGKMIASSKRKVRWRFGFPNQQALSAGRTGADCRGEEHDIVIIWSVTSGKRQVYFDGTEIHFSSSRAGIFQYSWSAKGNHVMKVVAHASPPMSGTPGFRQYDLFIDGQSFFMMPKSYELGLRGPISSSARVPGGHGRGGYGGYVGSPGVRAPTSMAQEDDDLRKAISASLRESRQFLANKDANRHQSDYGSTLRAPPGSAPAVATGDLMGFGQQGVAPRPGIQDSQTVMSYTSMPPTYNVSPTPQYEAQSQLPNRYHATPANGQRQQQPALYQSQPAGSNALVLSAAPRNSYAVAPSVQQPTAGYGAASMPAAQPAYSAPPVQAVDPDSRVPPPAYGSTPIQPGTVTAGDLFAPPAADHFPVAPAAPPAGDPFGFSQPQPTPATDDPFAPKAPLPPSRQSINNTILSAYQPQQGLEAQPSHPGQLADPGYSRVPPHGMHQYTHGLSMNDGFQAQVPIAPQQQQKPLSDLEKAMKKLVNVECIDEPAEQEYHLTMKKKEEAKKLKDGRSRGLPPVENTRLGQNATLNDIQEVKPNTPKTGEGIMKTPPQLFRPDAVHAGALVVRGQGPPPIQRGFGVGYGSPPPNYQQQRW